LPCGCCEGVESLTPSTVGNRPGLNAIEYRAGTHGTFLETMKARLAGSEFASIGALKTRHASDPSIALLDAWATVGDVLTFHQERIANEGYLRTATERLSVLELARLVGYELRPGVAANAYLAYTLDKPIAIPALIEKPELTLPPPDPLVTIPEGSRAQSIPGPGELPQAFETADDLVARFAWNNLQVRLNQPQQIDADTRTIYLKGLPNLKPGDPLMIIASPPALYRIETITPEPPANRTKVTFRPWLEIDLPRPPSAALLDNIAAIAERFSAVEHFRVRRNSLSASQVLKELTRLRKLEAGGVTAEEMKRTVEEEVLPKLKELHQSAVAGRFTLIEPWLQQIVEELQIALQGGGARSTAGLTKIEEAPQTADLTAVLPALSKPRSIPPKDSQELGRSVGGSLSSTTDIAPQVLTSLRPELKPVLYKAWQNVPVTPPPPFEVYSFKVRASIFGHNAPLEPIRNDAGVITGSKEWDLLVPGTTETFEIQLGPENERVFTANIVIGDKESGVAELEGESTRIDFPAANERIEVTISRTTTEGRIKFIFRFLRRPIAIQIEVIRGSLFNAGLIRDDPAVKLAAPMQTSNQQISIKGQLRAGGAQVSEEPRITWLDAPYPQILPGSWVALEKPSSLFDPFTGEPERNGATQTANVTLGPFDEATPAALPPARDGLGDAEKPEVALGVVPIKLPEFAESAVAYVPEQFEGRVPLGLVVWTKSASGDEDGKLIERWKATCHASELILLVVRSRKQAVWEPAEAQFVRRAMEHVAEKYDVDRSRIACFGEGADGPFAMRVALAMRGRVTAAAVAEAALPAALEIPAAEPLAPLAFYSAQATDSRQARRIDAGIARLRSAEYPVTNRTLAAAATTLAAEDIAELGRWLAALDRL
jgi:hypothetical protein